VGWRETLFRDLVLESKATDSPPREAAAALLAEEVVKGNLTLKNWDHTVEQWIIRVNCLAKWCPEFQMPAFTPDDRKLIVEQVCLGAVSYKDIKERPVWPALKAWLNPAQQGLVDKYAPERVELANGRKAKLTYVPDADPFISLRIEDLYDVKECPRIAQGRATIVVHILGPNYRPVQVTQDLSGFWRNHYPRVKQELQRKYPKHEWR
jgi:ATP-dependent helicase HrpB